MIVGFNLIALPTEKGSGAMRYMQMMFKAMGAYQLSNCQFILYHQENVRPEYFKIPDNVNVEYVVVPSLGGGLKRVLFEQTLFYFYLKKCDVLYSPFTSLPLFANCRKVFTLHDVYYITTKGRYSRLKTRYLKFMTEQYIKRCDKVLTVSQFSYDEILRLTSCKKEKLAVTYNFLLPQANTIDESNCLLKTISGTTVNLEEPFFLYVGSIQPSKNIIGMVKGFEVFCQKHQGYQLIIAGQPTYCGQELIKELSKFSHVRYVGYQDRKIIEFLFKNCVSTVLLSFCEGFGIPPIEGFGYGKPALVSNMMSLPEVVGKAGCLVDPHDCNAIAEGFYTMIENRDEFYHHIPEQLQKFDYNASVQTFMNVLGISYSEQD